MARPKIRIDLSELERLAGLQCTDEELAAWFNVSIRTITRRRSTQKFREALERGQARSKSHCGVTCGSSLMQATWPQQFI